MVKLDMALRSSSNNDCILEIGQMLLSLFEQVYTDLLRPKFLIEDTDHQVAHGVLLSDISMSVAWRFSRPFPARLLVNLNGKGMDASIFFSGISEPDGPLNPRAIGRVRLLKIHELWIRSPDHIFREYPWRRRAGHNTPGTVPGIRARRADEFRRLALPQRERAWGQSERADRKVQPENQSGP